MSTGFIRRELLKTSAKAGSEKRLEGEAQCDGRVNVKGQSRGRVRAFSNGRERVGHGITGQSFKRWT